METLSLEPVNKIEPAEVLQETEEAATTLGEPASNPDSEGGDVAAVKKRGRPKKDPGAPKSNYTRKKTATPAPIVEPEEEEEEEVPPPEPEPAPKKKAKAKAKARQAAAPPLYHDSSSESEREDMNTAVLRYLVQRKNAERQKREALWQSFLP